MANPIQVVPNNARYTPYPSRHELDLPLPPPEGAYLVECYVPRLDERRVELFGRRLRGAAARRRPGTVRLLASAGLPGDDSLLTIFRASSRDAVAATVEQAGLPADRIVPVVWHPDGRKR